jgi:hypothetical protein
MSAIYEGVPVDLEGPLAKVDRARQHVEDLARDVQELVRRWVQMLDEIAAEAEGDTRRAHVIREGDFQVPPGVPVKVGEVVYLLGSALDQLMCALVLRNGLTECSKTYFPIRETAALFETALRTIKGIDPATLDAVKRLEPYKSGDRVLWPLRALYNHDKHRALVTAAAGGNLENKITLGGWFSLGVFVGGPHLLKSGDEVLLSEVIVDDAGVQIEKLHRVHLAFDEPTIWPKPEVVTLFMQIAVERVDQIVRMFR